MKVTIFQIDIAWADPDENVKKAQFLLDTNPDSDLYVLPETWSTGFATVPHDIAENKDSIALSWMQQRARERRCAFCGSLAFRTDDGEFRNRHFFVTPESCVFYDKHHLFSHGHEDRYFTAGQEHVVTEWQGHRFLLLTCYDLRFPLWSRYGRAGEYEAIIVVANWPEARREAWRVLTRARAVENQCFLIGANRVGDDTSCHYCGESVIADTTGKVLAEAAPNVETSITADLDFDRLAAVRRHFKVLDDRD